ncbi:MAG TPA: hypothetical protein VGS27_11485 [Candidatus Sulfotelmatobacter sp.]|nr:hypothetical protein [Candidatus Sulfotelmatobacter sp.]
MARPIEQSESADALPKRELNPLQNPILADNMGRWAEAYFTSPPEKREEAVQELLRELEREQRERGTTAANMPERRPLDPTRTARIVPPSMMFRDQQQAKTSCPACGHENPVAHQFCGMCGSRLETRSGASNNHSASHAPPAEHYSQETHSPPPSEDYEQTQEEVEDEARAAEGHSPAPEFQAADRADELPLFRSILGTQYQDENWEYDEEPPSNPYRYYVALVLAIIIGVLGYMAWRGAQASQSTREASPPPPAPVTESAPAPAASSAPAPTEPAQPQPSNANSQKSAASSAEKSAENKTPAPVSASKVERRTPVPEPAAERSTSAPSSIDNGSAELATAEQYLNGSAGHARDGAEAAKWLWKAMAKHNGPATLLLSDLYLRGEGVAKNCDQGRVLLDSAARQGVAGAGERLRNLQAFGCH